MQDIIAMLIASFENGIINRCSDDGEPSGTAGAPMLNIINSKELTNILVIVTRYFGGILLGTGGLVRAYTSSMQEALKKIVEVKKEQGLEVRIISTYQDLEKIKYYLNQKDIKIANIEYLENVEIYIDISKNEYNNILKNINDLNFKINDINIIKEKYIIQNI